MDTQLTEPQRQQLDGIVQKMYSMGKSKEYMQAVVNDFKQKYGTPVETPTASQEGFFSSIGTGLKNIGKDILGIEQNKSTSFIPSLVQSTIGSKGLAGVAQLPGRVASSNAQYNTQADIYTSAADTFKRATDLLNQSRAESDSVKKAKLYKAYQDTYKQGQNLQGIAGGVETTTPGQALGTTINAGLTAATSGTGSLAEQAGLTGFKAFGARVAENAALGAGFQVGSNLADNRPIGENVGLSSVIGGALPIAGVGFQKARELATPSAEAFINSLIKPVGKDFAYGKNPARGILNEGIVANTFDDFSRKVEEKINLVGQDIGETGKIIDKAGITLDLTPALTPINKAIQDAAKNNNTSLFNSLNNVKIALLHDLKAGVDNTGNPTIVKGEAKNLIGAGYNEAKQFLDDIAAHTRYTGNPSDDKALNLATRKAYSIARNLMNEGADNVSPQLGQRIRNLNERYGDLLSAKNAINHRELVLKRQNFLNLADRFSIPVAVASGLITGNWQTAGAVLLGELGLKAVGSTASKTRIAQFLSRLAPQERQGILNSTPALKNWYERITGQTSSGENAPKTKSLQAVQDFAKNPKLGLSIEDVSKRTSDLAQEARKYKSAEEFVNGAKGISQAETGKPIVVTGYHGTPDARFAEEFNPKQKGYFKDAPDLLPNNSQWNELYGGTNKGFQMGQGVYEGLSFSDSKAVAKSYADKPAFDSQNSVPMVLERKIVLNNPKVIDVAKGEWQMSLENEIKTAKNEGHDGLIFKNIKDNYHPKTTIAPSNNVIVFNTDAIKTKSQLIDIWNKANKK